MTSQEEIERTAERLRDAFRAAADVMTAHDTAGLTAQTGKAQTGKAQTRRARTGKRHAAGWLVPLAAAACVVVIAVAAVFVADRGGGKALQPATAGSPPRYYMVLDATTHGWQLEVRRTADETVTDVRTLPRLMLNDGNLAADASDRAFYTASYPSCGEGSAVSRFYRITIGDSGQITGHRAVGSPVSGTIQSFAISPDGSRMAYTSLACPGRRVLPPPLATSIHVMDLSSGLVRTWRNTAASPGPHHVTALTGSLSWTPDGRTVIAVAEWGPREKRQDLSVLGLDTASAGGSLQASSRVLLSQGQGCVVCVTDAFAGPDGDLTAVKVEYHGLQARHIVVSVARGTSRQLYSDATRGGDFGTAYADSSGRWIIVSHQDADSTAVAGGLRAGWIKDGKLIPLPVPSLAYVYAVAW